MRIADVLKNKGTAVVTISPETTVTELLAGLTELNIGAMVVMGPDGLAGIVSGVMWCASCTSGAAACWRSRCRDHDHGGGDLYAA